MASEIAVCAMFDLGRDKVLCIFKAIEIRRTSSVNLVLKSPIKYLNIF